VHLLLDDMSELNTHKIKRIGDLIISQYAELFGSDFNANKTSLDQVLVFPSKRIRNRVAGYITRVAKRSGPTVAQEQAEISEETQQPMGEELEAEKPVATSTQQGQEVEASAQQSSQPEKSTEEKQKPRKARKSKQTKQEEGKASQQASEGMTSVQPNETQDKKAGSDATGK